MKPFTKQETLGLTIIFLILVVISVPNFALSIKRARDNTRKADLGSMVYALDEYQKDFQSFPLATEDGRIIACVAPGSKIEVDEKGRSIVNLIPCEWGVDGLYDPRDEDRSEAYIKIIPTDPQNSLGSKYFYFSNGRRYQIYAALEALDDDQYNLGVVSRNLMCGNRICSTGRSYSTTPIDKSLEEYEDELNEKYLEENAKLLEENK
jgi:hypothetical protein